MGINHYHIADFFESDYVAITLDNSYICEDAFIRRTELHDPDGYLYGNRRGDVVPIH